MHVVAGCTDALTYLGEPAVVSVGTLFQAALLPGIMLALLYALYAFGYALFNPSKAPAVEMGSSNNEVVTRGEALTWYLGVPLGDDPRCHHAVLRRCRWLAESDRRQLFGCAVEAASLRTNVSPDCQASMIELHGQEAWDKAWRSRPRLTMRADRRPASS